MPIASPSQDKIVQAGGLEWVCQQLEDGHSQRDIAKGLGISVMVLNDWLHASPLQSVRARAAMEAGAEAHESRAVAILEAARQEIRDDPQIAGSITALARERAQAAWRQASVRSPRYNDKRSTTLDVTITHAAAALSTQDLERIASQALTLLPDGTVEGGASDIGEPGE